MFVLDPSRSFIEAAEPMVMAIYRSRAALPLPGCPDTLPTAQAFVCLLKYEEAFEVQLAFHFKSIRRNMVCRVDGNPVDRSDGEAPLAAALDLVEALGFGMENLNLKFTRALREVVVRDIPVLLPPEAARQAVRQRAAELAELERLAAESVTDNPGEEAAAGLSTARQATARRARMDRQAEVRSATKKLAAERVAEEQLATIGSAFRQYLSSRTEAEPVETSPAVGAVATVSGSAVPPTAGKTARELVPVPAARKEKPAVVPPAAADPPLAGPQENERARRKDLLAQNSVDEERVAKLSAEVRLGEERLLQERAERKRLEVELAQAMRQVESQREAARVEREQLSAAKAVIEQRTAELASAVRLSEEQLAVERAERERLEKALAKATRQSAKRFVAEREQLTAAKADAEKRVAEMAETARLAVERAASEQRQRELLAQELAGRKPTGEIKLAPAAGAAQVKVAEPPPAPAAPRPPVPGAFFQVDLRLPCIEYSAADEIAEIHQSLCNASLSLEGYPSQYCSAYVIAMKKARGREIFVAFRLSASNRVLVYVPAQQPQNQSAYAKALQEALKFLRVVGMETEDVPLESIPEVRARTIAAIPVLGHLPRCVQGF